MMDSSVSNPGFPEPETRFLAIFNYPKSGFFQLPNPGIKKTLEFYSIQMLVSLMTLKLQISACKARLNLQILS